MNNKELKEKRMDAQLTVALAYVFVEMNKAAQSSQNDLVTSAYSRGAILIHRNPEFVNRLQKEFEKIFPDYPPVSVPDVASIEESATPPPPSVL